MSTQCPFCKPDNTKLYLKLKDYFLSQEDFEIFECENCNLLFTTPRPDASVIGRYYKSDDYLSHNEHKKGIVPWIYNQVKKVNIRRKFRITAQNRTSSISAVASAISCITLNKKDAKSQVAT